MAPARKLSDGDVKRIRRRVQSGEYQTDLAAEFGVDRKTIRRRLNALERSETERAARLAAKDVRRQAAREKAKWLERKRNPVLVHATNQTQRRARTGRVADPRLEWLDSPKNLSGRARAEASGLVRVRNSNDTRRVWVERSEIEALLDEGWRLDE